MRTLLYIPLYILLGLSISETSPQWSKIALKKQIISGEELIFQFQETVKNSRLILHNSYGKVILKPVEVDDELVFQTPEFLTAKSGTLYWKLISGTNQKAGQITILPNAKPVIIENYYGPRSIQAGNRDYSMLVSIPTDRFDNPLADGTKVEVSEYFQGDLSKDSLEMENMFAWKNVYSRQKSGKILVSNSSKNLQAKEMISDVYPSIASDFEIRIEREHDYADGNMVSRIITSKIMDEYGNIVSDGTAVEFLVKNEDEAVLKTMATTIDGVATAKILHPEFPQNWKISSNITGMAESNEIEVSYQAVMSDFDAVFQEEKEKIIVGPLKSFMGQFIPDGVEVKLVVISKNGDEKLKMQQPSENGYAIFQLPEGENYQDSYTFKIEALGVTKSIQ